MPPVTNRLVLGRKKVTPPYSNILENVRMLVEDKEKDSRHIFLYFTRDYKYRMST